LQLHNIARCRAAICRLERCLSIISARIGLSQRHNVSAVCKNLRALRPTWSSLTDDMNTYIAVVWTMPIRSYMAFLLQISTNSSIVRTQSLASFYSSHVLLFNTSWTGFTGSQSAPGLISKLRELISPYQPSRLINFS